MAFNWYLALNICYNGYTMDKTYIYIIVYIDTHTHDQPWIWFLGSVWPRKCDKAAIWYNGQIMVQTSTFGAPYLQTNPRDLIEGENIRKAMWVWINWINTKFPLVISSMVCWKSHHLNRWFSQQTNPPNLYEFGDFPSMFDDPIVG